MLPDAVAEYRRCFATAEAIHASCEDYRAAASIDLVHDEADLDRRHSGAAARAVGRQGAGRQDVRRAGGLARRAARVRGRPLDCAHYLPEEKADETARR